MPAIPRIERNDADAAEVDYHLSALRACEDGNHADRRVSVVL